MSGRLTSFLFKYLWLAVMIPAAALSVAAQKPKPSPTPLPEDPQTTVKVAIRRVRLPITVTDKKGQFVPGLTHNDFVILEDKVPQAIETFSDDLSQTTPLYIAVLMDTSPSTAGKLKFQQESAMNFIQTVVSRARTACSSEPSTTRSTCCRISLTDSIFSTRQSTASRSRVNKLRSSMQSGSSVMRKCAQFRGVVCCCLLPTVKTPTAAQTSATRSISHSAPKPPSSRSQQRLGFSLPCLVLKQDRLRTRKTKTC